MTGETAVEEREFSAEASSVSGARRFVLGAAGVDDPIAESLQLAVSEVATNAVLHARSPFRVRVSRNSRSVLVEVFDRSSTLPSKKDYGPAAPTGRGLTIVERVTHDWGVRATDEGKWVWFEIALLPTTVP